MNDLISVIVPIYNTGTPLKRCIDSLLSQTYSPIEIILVDDGSTDGITSSICQEYKRNHPSIVLIHQENGGAAKARNTGIVNAKGRFLAFVDSDDSVDSDAYFNLHEAIIHYDTPIVLGNLTIEGTHQAFGNCGLPDGIYKKNTILSKFLQGYWCSACTNLYNAKTIRDIRFPVNEVNEDYIFNFKVIMNCENIGIVNKPYYHYIRRADSVTSQPASLKFLDWINHAVYVRDQVKESFGRELESEANFQYLYANIVLANKCILTFIKGKNENADKLYDTVVSNLRKDKRLILKNKFLKKKYKISGICLISFPNLYKYVVSHLFKLAR